MSSIPPPPPPSAAAAREDPLLLVPAAVAAPSDKGLMLADSLWFEFGMVLLVLLFVSITVAECSAASDAVLPYGLGVTSAVLLAVLGGEVVVVRAWLFRGNFRKRHLVSLVLTCTAFGLQVAVLVPPPIAPAVLVSSRVFSLLVSMYAMKRVSDFVLTSQVWLNGKHRSDQLTTLERCLQVLKDFETKHLISESDRASMQWLTMTIASHRLYQDTDKQHGPNFHGADEDTSKWLRGTYTQHQAVATPTSENPPVLAGAGGATEEEEAAPTTKPLLKVGSGAGSTFSTNSAVKSKLARSASMPPQPPQRNSSIDGGDSVVGHYMESLDLGGGSAGGGGGSGKDHARVVTGALFGLTAQDVQLLQSGGGEEEDATITIDVDKLNREIDEWEFDAFAVHDRYPLSLCLFSSLRKNLSLDALGVSSSVLANFALEIERGYVSTNVYHNKFHAADVVQCFHHMLTHVQMRQCTTPLDRLVGLIACAIHDYKHPGVNNTFLSQTSSPLAIQYNDIAILESMHVSSAFQLMRNEPAKYDVFAHLPLGAQREARETMVQMVLATDMKSHFDIIRNFQTAIGLPAPDKSHDHLGAWWSEFEQHAAAAAGSATHSASFNATQGFALPVTAHPLEYRRLVLKTALHCADVSNPARPLNLAVKLAELVQEEFFLQGDLEKQHKLPVSLFMDRDRPAFPKMQVGFIEFIVKPLLDTYWMWLKPYKGSADVHLATNLEYWKKRAEQESSAATAVASSPLLPPRSAKSSRHRPQSSMGEEMPSKRPPPGHHRRTNSEHTSRNFLSAMVAAATAPPLAAGDVTSPKPSRADTLV